MPILLVKQCDGFSACIQRTFLVMKDVNTRGVDRAGAKGGKRLVGTSGIPFMKLRGQPITQLPVETPARSH